MTARRVQHAEWETLRQLWQTQFGELPPYVDSSLVVVAEEEGTIQALLAIQLLVHSEPLWVSDDCKDPMVVAKLIKEAMRHVPDLNYCFANTTNNRVGTFLERIGFTRLPWAVYRWIKKEA